MGTVAHISFQVIIWIHVPFRQFQAEFQSSLDLVGLLEPAATGPMGPMGRGHVAHGAHGVNGAHGIHGPMEPMWAGAHGIDTETK